MGTSLAAQTVESACSAWDPGSIPGLGKSPGERNGNPLQYFWLENPHGQRNLSSVQFSRLVLSDSLEPHGLQHARLPCPSLTPGVYSNSCSLSRWCHPTIWSSVVCFSSHLQSFPPSGSFKMSQRSLAGYKEKLQRVGHDWATSLSFNIIFVVFLAHDFGFTFWTLSLQIFFLSGSKYIFQFKSA